MTSVLHRVFQVPAHCREEEIKFLKNSGPGDVTGQSLVPLPGGFVAVVLTRVSDQPGRREVIGYDLLVCTPADPRDHRTRTAI